MSVLLDTSVLGRFARIGDPEHSTAVDAVRKLELAGEVICITPQNLIEFRNFATRPTAQNGLGMTAAEAEAESAKYERAYRLLADTAAIFPIWKNIVQTLGVIGKQVHDARLTAVCQAHQVAHLLTFNVAHFQRFSAAANPVVLVLNPRSM